MRLDRYLANMGCGSRSGVKRWIRSGAVTVNGRTIRDEAFQLEPGVDEVCGDGRPVRWVQYLYLMLNKPAGVVSATEDQRDRTVLDLLEERFRNKDLFPVGRLDKDTEGLLLLTNHGELGHRLLAPKKHVPKRYLARVDGPVDDGDRAAFRAGIDIGGYRTLPAELLILDAGTRSEVEVIIHEGKFHQIKRMFEAVGKPVLYLKRVAMGELELDPALRPGEYRELTPAEAGRLLQTAGLAPESS
ncbi:ribosomal small subunit pseudouridine synthase A [Hydrogenispora ethanolica]|jgi:16S rRNA pseudouridine516 synthase|uniref:Pseudouridine synthase n=1 Tax=Hydrogenispora ethanolica TaxID=1082276 RepID=A0A4R1S7A6_HYDET|nr:pseudouridine synthase [Hydrogenispora ethanolica]TCL75246.1 ribosomal small subunit pseudouridine synthase A [Hydrogenispora ethanolica]